MYDVLGSNILFNDYDVFRSNVNFVVSSQMMYDVFLLFNEWFFFGQMMYDRFLLILIVLLGVYDFLKLQKNSFKNSFKFSFKLGNVINK